MRGLSLVAASGGHSSSRCAGLSLSQPLLLWSTGSRRAGSVIVAHGPSCSAACGIFPDQGSNPCPLHWQADSQPLRHQGSPDITFKCLLIHLFFSLEICVSKKVDHLSYRVVYILDFVDYMPAVWFNMCLCPRSFVNWLLHRKAGSDPELISLA